MIIEAGFAEYYLQRVSDEWQRMGERGNLLPPERQAQRMQPDRWLTPKAIAQREEIAAHDAQRCYRVGVSDPHVVYAVDPEEGEWKTACECLHPVVALALRDLLNAAWTRQGKQGSMPHLRYTGVLLPYNAVRNVASAASLAAWAEERIARFGPERDA